MERECDSDSGNSTEKTVAAVEGNDKTKTIQHNREHRKKQFFAPPFREMGCQTTCATMAVATVVVRSQQHPSLPSLRLTVARSPRNPCHLRQFFALVGVGCMREARARPV